MPRVCTVCTAPGLREIDVAIAGGRESLASIADRHGLGHRAVASHRKNHLTPALVRVAAARRSEESASGAYQSVLSRLETLADRIDGFVDLAEQKGSLVGGAAVLREMRATLETIAKITGELDETPKSLTVNLLSSPEVGELVQRLLGALAPYPQARIAVAAALDMAEAS